MDFAQFTQMAPGVLGVRQGQYTTAIGCVGNLPITLFGAYQGGPLNYAVMKARSGLSDVIDARSIGWLGGDETRRLGQLTGFHAEMMVLRAILTRLQIPLATSLEDIGFRFENSGGVFVAADAPC